MLQLNVLKVFSRAILVLLAFLLVVTDASARPDILDAVSSVGIDVTAGCATCHNGAIGNKNNIKPNYQAAYRLDTVGFTRLTNLINGCPNGQALDTTTYICAASAPLPIVCTAPEVRDTATNTCILPPCPPVNVPNVASACVPSPPSVVCVAPKVLDSGTNTCVLPPCPTGQTRDTVGICVALPPPPVVCVVPQVRDAATNKCVLPPCPTGQTRNTVGVCVVPPSPPVSCVAPKVVDSSTNTCVLPPCPTGQTRDAKAVCVVPTPTSCISPKKVISGVCILPPLVTCDDKDEDDDDDHDHDNKTGLNISDPGKITVHAGKMMRVGIAVFGDYRKTEIAVSKLPKDAKFYDTYNPSLRSKEGVLLWQVPTALAGKKMQFKICGKTSGGSKGDSHVQRHIKVEILPPTNNLPTPDPIVSDHYVTSSVYDDATGKLEVCGQVKWLSKSRPGKRQSAILEPVEIVDAESNTPLGTAKIGLDGRWSASIAVPAATVPRVVDATFLGRLATETVHNSSVSDSKGN